MSDRPNPNQNNPDWSLIILNLRHPSCREIHGIRGSLAGYIMMSKCRWLPSRFPRAANDWNDEDDRDIGAAELVD
jgi:hypothetical protein